MSDSKYSSSSALDVKSAPPSTTVTASAAPASASAAAAASVDVKTTANSKAPNYNRPIVEVCIADKYACSFGKKKVKNWKNTQGISSVDIVADSTPGFTVITVKGEPDSVCCVMTKIAEIVGAKNIGSRSPSQPVNQTISDSKHSGSTALDVKSRPPSAALTVGPASAAAAAPSVGVKTITNSKVLKYNRPIVEVCVAEKYTGRLIGKKGRRVKKWENVQGISSVVIVSGSGLGFAVITVKGKPDSVCCVMTEITQMVGAENIRSRSEFQSQSQSVKIRIPIPHAAVGLVIGKKGANHKELKSVPGIHSLRMIKGGAVITGTQNSAAKVASKVNHCIRLSEQKAKVEPPEPPKTAKQKNKALRVNEFRMFPDSDPFALSLGSKKRHFDIN